MSTMIRLNLRESDFERSFRQFREAERMTVEEIRALNHQWESIGNYWVTCRVCGAACPSDQIEDPNLFRKDPSRSLLTTAHKQAEETSKESLTDHAGLFI